MLNLTPQRWKASAKVEQNLITTKPVTNFFYAKTKIISEMAKFDMWKWQNQRKDGRKQAKKGKENSVRVRLFIAQNPRSPPKVQYATTQNMLAASRNRKLISEAALEPRK